MAEPKFAIQTTKLSKQFGRKKVLREIDLTVQVGETYGFLGPNGAGKTTTISCLMDFIRPTSGSIKLFGLDSRARSVQLKRQIGYVPADPQLYPNLTGRQHVQLYQALFGGTDQAAKLADRLGLGLTTKAKHLSTGNQQKLSLTLALASSPKLLILDEPTKGLDPLLQEELYNILRDFREAGGTVFISSHNLAEVQKLCDRVGIIKEGELVASESMDHLRDLAIHEVTIEFASAFKADAFQAKGTTIVAHSPRSLILRVSGDINPLVTRLAAFPVKDLEITHANLEEVFMRYYRSDQ